MHARSLDALVFAAALGSACGGSHPAATGSTSTTHAGPPWNYGGERGPDHWGTLAPAFAACGTGRMQSPVDLPAMPDHAAGAATHTLTWSYHPGPASIVNNGHTVVVNVRDAGGIVLDGVSYALVQYHFHAPGEHRFGGTAYPMELHFVHRDGAGHTAVVGLMVRGGGMPNPLVAQLASEAPNDIDHERGIGSADVRAVLPDAPHRYALYDGSLTAPPCTEGVHWIVLADPRDVSQDDIAALAARIGPNARPIQTLGSRAIETVP